MLLSAICKMSANSRRRKRCGVSIDLQNVRRQDFYILFKYIVNVFAKLKVDNEELIIKTQT